MNIDDAFSILKQYMTPYKLQVYVSKKLNISFYEAGKLVTNDREYLVKRLVFAQTIASGCISDADAQKQLCLEMIDFTKQAFSSTLKYTKQQKTKLMAALGPFFTESKYNEMIVEAKKSFQALEDLQHQLQNGE